MADSFEKWLNRQLKERGRANIDKETCGERGTIFWGSELKELRLNWPELIKESEEQANLIESTINAGEIDKQRFVHYDLEDIFYSEFNVISAYFKEYYDNTAIYDRQYLKGLVKDFRMSFPVNARFRDEYKTTDGSTHYSPIYFDDMICRLMAEYEDQYSGEIPLMFPNYLIAINPDQLAEKMKGELKGCKTKDYAALYIALEKTGLIKYSKDNKAIYQAMIEYFGDFGNYQGFMKYLNPNTTQHFNLEGSKRIEYFKNWLNKEK